VKHRWSVVPFLLIACVASAQEAVDLDTLNRIRDEGLNRPQVMATVEHLTDVIGPRLTGSPQLETAGTWVRDRLGAWGLSARLERSPFGQGWSFSSCDVRLLTPAQAPLSALPKAWTPGTEGPVRGRIVRADLASDDDLEHWRGKLSGAVVLLDPARTPEQIEGEMFSRWDADGLERMKQTEIPDQKRAEWRRRYRKTWDFAPKLAQFLHREGVVATVEASSRDNGVVRVTGGGSWGRPDRDPGVPSLVMAAEHYNRLVRLVEADVPTEVEIDVAARFTDGVEPANVIGELPGTDLADQVVMAGAHLDSWHAGTGATDDAGGVAIVMEALRILSTLPERPRRTIRIGLWFGEEQGFLGSSAYVAAHLASRPEPTDPEQLALPAGLRKTTWPITPRPEHRTFSGYFNVDFGAGRIRGIYAQGNVAAAPTFTAWLAPLADLGATTVSLRSVGGTDHLPFDRVGLPAFQFIQDGLDYMSRTHHSDLDTFDHLHRDDLVQAAVVVASFLWDAANRPELLPRKPMPTPPAEEASEAGDH